MSGTEQIRKPNTRYLKHLNPNKMAAGTILFGFQAMAQNPNISEPNKSHDPSVWISDPHFIQVMKYDLHDLNNGHNK
jgi:hypothetical protein